MFSATTRHRSTTATAATLALAASLLVAGQSPAAAAPRYVDPTTAAPADPAPVHGRDLPGVTHAEPASSRSVATPATTLQGSATVRLSSRVIGEATTTGIPGVSVIPTTQSPATTVRIAVLTTAELATQNLQGPVIRVTRADGRSGAPGVAPRVDAATLRGLSGANYAARVSWVPVAGAPQQSATTPEPSVASSDSSTITAQAPAASTQLFQARAAATAADGTGSFAATSLTPASSWDVSAQTGSFSWNYPMRVPPVAGDLQPDLGLSYSSGAIDGETASTNNQPSGIGEGWELNAGGYVERSYAPCSIDGRASSGDLCWKNDNATMSFAGHSGPLVHDTGNLWHLQGDDGSRIERLTGATNGDGGAAGIDGTGEYWRLTTVDGTQYYFGMNRLPGWTAGKETTRSTLTVPVFGNNAGEPCNGATFAGSSCVQAWRWNLDYVVAPHQDSMAYFYTADTNSYLRSGTTLVTYERAAQLARIDYGTSGGSALTGLAPARVSIGNVPRCNDTTNPCDAADGHRANAPDVPWDQQCSTAADCAGHVSPTFFTSTMIASVTAGIRNAAGNDYDPVDVWGLTHSFPAPGDTTSPALWLANITHSGTSTAETVPVTTFTGTPMQNRVLTVDGAALQFKYRISSLVNETGATVTVSYSQGECDTARPAPETNTKRCFPVWWQPEGHAETLEWFNKYVVTAVSADPNTGGANQSDDTYYDYLGTPGWRYDDSPVAADNRRSWSSFAGYDKVRVRHGNDTDPASQETTTHLYFRGLNGDRLNASGGTKTAQVTASDTTTVSDDRWLAGKPRETTVSNGNSGSRANPTSGPRVSNTIVTYWAAQTATDGRYTAYLTANSLQLTRTALTAGGDRTTRTATTPDSYGRPTTIDDAGDTAITTDDRCTSTAYADNTTTWILNRPSQVTVVAGPCSSTPQLPRDAISNTRNYYDLSTTLGAAPTRGDATRTDNVDSYTGSTPHWQTTSTTTTDPLGRPATTTDPRTGSNRTDTYSYEPAGTGLLTKLTTTNTLGWSTVSEFDPRWGQVTKLTDFNAHITESSYDGLGRRIAVWLPDRPRSTTPTPSVGYQYNVRNNGPTTVDTTSLTPTGGTNTSFTLYDGLGRTRQTQSPAKSTIGSRTITDTLYDHAGRAAVVNAPYWNEQAPSGTLFEPGNTLAGQTKTTYDGAGRTKVLAQWVLNAEKWTTSYTYGGDHVDVTPPTGGTPTTTTTDARGQTTSVAQYSGTTPAGAADTTRYQYSPAGNLITMTDPADNVWTWHYDTLGRQDSAHDPDAGNSTNSYDPAGRLTGTTDGVGNTIAYSYDDLDRKTGSYQGSLTGARLGSWQYDTISASVTERGQLASSTRYLNNQAYATSKVNTLDPLDRPTSQAVVIATGALAGTYVTATHYGQDGQITYIGHGSYGRALAGDGVTYGFDNMGNPTEATGANGAGYVSATTYNGLGQLARYSADVDTRQFTRQFGYEDGTGRLSTDTTTTNITGNRVAASHSFTYNNAGLVTKDANTATVAGTDTQCYSYDTKQQLTEAWTPSSGNCGTARSGAALSGPAPYWTTYTYDSIGNRRSTVSHTSSADTTETYAYPPSSANSDQPHALQSTTKNGSTAAFQYDNAGNTTKRPGNPTVTWNSEGQLAAATASGSRTASFTYDADGNRLVEQDTTGTTLYLGDTELHADPDGTQTATRTYSYQGQPVAERIAKEGTAHTVNLLLADANGSAEVAVNTTTGAVQRRHTDAFGNNRDTPALNWASGHGFLNAPTDNLTATTHLGVREYDPARGRFLSVDPVMEPANPAQSNGYGYGWNNPISNPDPTGTRPEGEVSDYDSGNFGTIERSDRSRNYGAASCSTRACGNDTAVNPAVYAPSQGVDKPKVSVPSVSELWDIVKYVASNPMAIIKEISGFNDLKGCLNGSMWDCGWVVVNLASYAMPLAKIGGVIKGIKAAKDAAKAAETARAVEAADAAAKTAGVVVKYDADFALGQVTSGERATASQLAGFGESQGWKSTQTASGPLKFTDANGIARLTIKRGSDRAAGSAQPHVEMRNISGQRVDSYGLLVTRKSPGNHTRIDWDLP